MTQIKITDSIIECDGHAGDKIKCAMLSSMTVSLIENITERLDIYVDYSLQSGYFRMNTKRLDAATQILVDSYIYSVISLANSFPDNFSITDNRSKH